MFAINAKTCHDYLMAEIIFIILTIIILIVLIFLLFKINSLPKSQDNSALQMLQNQINALAQSLDQRLENNSNSHLRFIQDTNKNNTEILRNLTEKISQIDNTNQQIIKFAEKLQEIQNIFKNPKQRGIIGEYFLENILKSVLPVSVFKMQYSFENGDIVDAVIFVEGKIIPIDAKFSIDSYTRLIENTDESQKSSLQKAFLNDIKKRVDETSKYVRTNEDTIDIALMFIPSDAIYHEVISLSYDDTISMNIINYAYTKKVILLSPTSFFGYIQTILLALNTIKVSKDIDEIVKYLNESTKYLEQFEESIDKVGKNINLLVNSYNRASIDAEQLSKRIAKISNNKDNLISIERLKNEENLLDE